jgi:hypothetical protein
MEIAPTRFAFARRDAALQLQATAVAAYHRFLSSTEVKRSAGRGLHSAEFNLDACAGLCIPWNASAQRRLTPRSPRA